MPHISVGLDIGTTTISRIVLDTVSGEVLDVQNVPNAAGIPSPHSWEHIQSPEKIWEIALALLDGAIDAYPAASIGITGQMHGILYTTAAGEPCSPLYTWQDGRAGLGAVSACTMIQEKTGYRTAAGYGLAPITRCLCWEKHRWACICAR